MNRKTSKITQTIAGISFLAGSLAFPLSAAAENPFSAIDLGNGYQVASKDAEGKCGEGKCGGAEETKTAEGKCGEGKCGGAEETKAAEGKCGEGKCGGAEEAKAAEGKCGGQ
ncbi:hypothetical protein CWI75_17845 [Kineobactrum sediminis]|uniref:Low-complexity protein n=1 Tax=Kineobactrum sediminis TaxID=1905677 RepID=A0A2N5XY12_9GAMM|nr:hypothetical protein [Kineobactrum sediminis]PLW81038.1 hypothetical protein CWI75_17845 [Kineobactrum sediminis]